MTLKTNCISERDVHRIVFETRSETTRSKTKQKMQKANLKDEKKKIETRNIEIISDRDDDGTNDDRDIFACDWTTFCIIRKNLLTNKCDWLKRRRIKKKKQKGTGEEQNQRMHRSIHIPITIYPVFIFSTGWECYAWNTPSIYRKKTDRYIHRKYSLLYEQN